MRTPSRWFDERRDSYLCGLMRLLLGVLICSQTYRIMRETAQSGYFGHVFHLPVVPDAWVPSESAYWALLGVQFLGGVLAVIGYQGRAGLLVASVTGIYLLACDRLHYHNNRFSLFLVAFLCAFAPSDRSFLLFRGRRHALEEQARVAPTWARRLMQFQVSLIYFTSSTGKLFDDDWRTGVAMLPRFQKGLAYLAKPESLVPAPVAAALHSPWFAEIMAKAAIGTELALAFGLWFPRTRVAALWLGFAFHLGIELNARVQLFSYLMGVSYVAFATPELHERELRVDPASALGRTVARLLPWLDWLARFRPSSVPAREGAIEVLERAGTEARGFRAWIALSRSIPVLFPAWPVLRLAAALRPEKR